MRSRPLSLGALAELCRTLRLGLHAGLDITRVVQQQAMRGPEAARPALHHVGKCLAAGSSLEDSLRDVKGAFPPLLLALVEIGEQTGQLPEIFAELERYYQSQVTLRREFLSQIAWPVLQLVLAVGVIAGLLLLMGLIAEPGKAIDPIGLGLVGPTGAAIFLGGVAGLVALGVGVWFLLQRLKQGLMVQRQLLRVPVLGPALEALALARFCLALSLTLGAGLGVPRSVRRALVATDNPAFAERADHAVTALKGGAELHEALAATGVLPVTILEATEVGEESGQVPEVMARLANQYTEESSRRLTALAWAAGGVVWLGVSLLLIVAIFRVAMVYVNALNAVG